jgi:hypothetical protein
MTEVSKITKVGRFGVSTICHYSFPALAKREILFPLYCGTIFRGASLLGHCTTLMRERLSEAGSCYPRIYLPEGNNQEHSEEHQQFADNAPMV